MSSPTRPKTWASAPDKGEVEAELRGFFDALQSRAVGEARDRVAHRFDDWEAQLHSLWQDTYLILLEDEGREVEDESFEGRAWAEDTTWLADLACGPISWDGAAPQAADREWLYAVVIYDGVETDVTAEFQVVVRDGAWVLERNALRIA